MLIRHSVWTKTALLSLFLTLLAVPAMSQSFYGSLVSVVKDAQEGFIPGATVILVNTSTNERREGVSGEDGTYRFLNLVPGTYRLEVELTGFQRFVRDGIAVNVQSAPRVEATLQLGSLSETVLVSGEAPVLQTENASIGIVMESSRIRQLSLNGGNVLNLITLAPSVVPQGGSEGSLTGKNVFAAGNYQIGGGTANQSASYFDGVTVQDSAYGNIVVLTPSPEAVEEFRVQTNNSSAEFGRFTGGVVNIASRSGTNTYRGSIFEQHRNKALNSNTFFGERAGLDKPPFVQNNFGGSMGGPVLTNKLFFFGSFEGYRNREGVLFRRTVPTAAMKNGDFSDYRGSGTTVVPIYDPWTQCGINNPGTGVFNGLCGAPGVPNRQQFPGNIIPQNRISPIAKKFLNFPIYGEPTVAGRWTTNNFERNASIGGDNNQVNVRADYNMSQNNRIIGRYTRFDSTNLPVDVYGNGQTNGDPYSPEHFITTQVMAADTYSFNSSTVLDVRFGMMRWDYDRTPGNLGTDPVSTFGLPVVPYGQIPERSDGVPPTIPSINAGSNQVIGTGLIYADDYTYSFTPTVTKIMGDHTLKAGANILNGEVNYCQNNNVGGTFTFANNPTALDGTNPGATGDPFASFLIGQPTGGTYQSSNFNYGRSHYQAYFIEDSWQMTSRLTVNLGFRLEKPGAYFETEDRLVTFNPDVVNPLLAGRTNPVTEKPYVGAFELVAGDTQPERTLRKNPLQFAPRVGVAYRLTDNTVLRGGGGTFYVPSTARFPDGPTGNPVNQRVNNIATSVDDNRTFFTDFSNPFPTGVQNYPGRD
ncbi:MAG TPA: TonB-dependent receptor, partial [Vicinamibacterales bacterium]